MTGINVKSDHECDGYQQYEYHSYITSNISHNANQVMLGFVSVFNEQYEYMKVGGLLC